ncbi:MAG: alpha/beta hydrolase [Halalkalicoccus sp.]|nr:alpha/beta hydrolase [Halalkalicoccus sp.]
MSDDYTTVAYDVREHGRTGGSARTAYSIGSFADDLDALVTALDLDRPVLCGLSMGGCIAQVYAATYPDRLAGLVLADTFTPDLLTRSEWVQRSLLLRATLGRFDSSATSAWRKRWCGSRNGSRDRASAATTGRSNASGPKDRVWRPRSSPR